MVETNLPVAPVEEVAENTEDFDSFNAIALPSSPSLPEEINDRIEDDEEEIEIEADVISEDFSQISNEEIENNNFGREEISESAYEDNEVQEGESSYEYENNYDDEKEEVEHIDTSEAMSWYEFLYDSSLVIFYNLATPHICMSNIFFVSYKKI